MSQFDPVNDNQAPPPPDDRRREARRRVFLQGKIVYLHNNFTADCTIKDISASGARIQINAEAITADPFLIVVRRAVVHESHTAWHSVDQAGLKLINTLALGEEAPLHMKTIQRVWMELMPRQD